MSNRTSLRMRVLPRFPARITGTNGLTVVQDNLDLVVKPDFGSLVPVPSVENPDTTFFLGWESTLDSYSSISFQNLVENIQSVIIGPTTAAMEATTPTTDQFIYFTGTDVAATTGLTAAGRALLDDANATAQRTTLGLGGSSTLNVGTTAGTVAAGDDSRIVNAVPNTRTLTAGTGIAAIGDLSANCTIALNSNSIASLALADTSIQPTGAGNLLFSHANSYAAGSVGNILKRIVRVTDAPFNAAMNGVTNDTAALQAAIDYVYGLGGGLVVIPPGQTVIGAVTLKPGVDILGAGEHSTNIRPLASGLVLFSLINALDSGTQITIGDFNIHCETGAAKTNIVGFSFQFCNYVTLKNIAFYGCKSNWQYDRGGLIRILDCVSSGTATLKAGAYFMGSTDDSLYGANFSVIQNYRIDNSGTGVQSPACYFRRCVGVEMSILANDGDFTGVCIAIENDCQGINITGLIPAYGVGLYLQKGGGIDKAPIFNDFRGLDFDQCGINAILVEAGEHNKFGGMITSSNVNVAGKAVVFTGAATKNNIIDHMHVSGYYNPGGSALLLSGTSGNLISGFKASGCYNGIEFSGANTNTIIQGGSVAELITNPILGTYTGAGNRILNLAGFDIPWQAYTPTITADSGTFTSVSATGFYRQIDSVMNVVITVTITTNGTAAGNIQATLPTIAARAAILAGKESALAGTMFVGLVAGGGNKVFINRYDGVYGAANGYVITISGEYAVV